MPADLTGPRPARAWHLPSPVLAGSASETHGYVPARTWINPTGFPQGPSSHQMVAEHPCCAGLDWDQQLVGWAGCAECGCPARWCQVASLPLPFLRGRECQPHQIGWNAECGMGYPRRTELFCWFLVHFGVKLGCKGEKRSAINWRKSQIQPK